MVRIGSWHSLFLIFASLVTNWGMMLSLSSAKIIPGPCMGQKQINNGKTQTTPVWIWDRSSLCPMGRAAARPLACSKSLPVLCGGCGSVPVAILQVFILWSRTSCWGFLPPGSSHGQLGHELGCCTITSLRWLQTKPTMSLLGWGNPLQAQDGSSLPGRAQTRCPFPFALMWVSVNAAIKYLLVQISFCGRNRLSLKSAPYKMWDRSGTEGLGNALTSCFPPLAAWPVQLQEQQMFKFSWDESHLLVSFSSAKWEP